MSLFENKEKRSDSNAKVINDEAVTTDDFQRMTPYWGYRPVEYSAYKPLFVELETVLVGYLDQLFAGEIDDANANVLDNIILDHFRMALKDLAIQRTSHARVIMDLAIELDGTKKQFQDKLDFTKRQLQEAEAEFNELNERYRNDKFKFRKGKR